MIPKKKVLAISGSTRDGSTNYKYIKAIELLATATDAFEIELFQGLAALPHFNPDMALENVPEQVLAFRKQIADADGILICTPEYAHGVPGSLKNAIDWTVTSADFDGKPTMLITASTDGREGHKSLLETLRVIQVKEVERLQLLISHAQTKINQQFEITDLPLLKSIEELIGMFQRLL
jgi:chromate reductase, NAD(P)H dehydrogenase (quinone)